MDKSLFLNKYENRAISELNVIGLLNCKLLEGGHLA